MFKSVFPIEGKTNVLNLSSLSYPPIEDTIEINPKCVKKLVRT